ncbi:alpha/beta fold hydrolase [Desulfobulbus propionicus]|jgi:abhydrolase domain-containing protein 14
MARITEQTLDLGSCRIHVLECGEAGAGAVILLHGMKFQAETWRALGTLDALAELGLHVLAVDMPGYGKSETSEVAPGTVLVSLYQRFGLAQAVLIGPSMGGRIALEFAIAHPEMIAGLVLVGAVGVKENRTALARITAPTLVVWGGEDQVSPLANSDILLAELAQARREIFPKAPHPCYLDQPERWHAGLKAFLADLNF